MTTAEATRAYWAGGWKDSASLPGYLVAHVTEWQAEAVPEGGAS